MVHAALVVGEDPQVHRLLKHVHEIVVGVALARPQKDQESGANGARLFTVDGDTGASDTL